MEDEVQRNSECDSADGAAVEFRGGKDWIRVQPLPIAVWGMGLLPWVLLLIDLLAPAGEHPSIREMGNRQAAAILGICTAVTLTCALIGWLWRNRIISRYRECFVRLDNFGIHIRDRLETRDVAWEQVLEIRWKEEYSSSEQSTWYLEFDTPSGPFLLRDWLSEADANAVIKELRKRIPDKVKCNMRRLPEGFRDSVQACLILGARYRNRKEYAKAELAYCSALRELESNLGKDTPECLPALRKYSELLRIMNRHDEAADLDRRVSEIRNRQKPHIANEHPLR